MAQYLRYYFLLFALLWMAKSTFAMAQDEIKGLTLEECVHYALLNSAKIHQSEAEERITSANYADAIGRLLPNVSVGSSAHINYGRGIDPRTNTYTNVNSFRNNYSIEGSLLLFDGLSSVYNLKRKGYEKKASMESLKQNQQEVRMSTIEAYYNLLYTKELKGLAQKNLENSEQQTKQLERMFELGMKAVQDVSEMKATEAADRLKLVQQNNQYEIAMLQLKAVMNYPIDKELIILDELSYSDVTPTLLQADEVYEMAIHHLPKALMAEQNLKSSKAAYQSSIGDFSPRINLFAGFNTSFSRYLDGSPYEPFKEQLANRRGAYVGASLSIDIFSGLRKSSELRRSKALYHAEQYKKREVDMEIYKEIQEAILNLNASVEEYHAAKEHAEHLMKVYEAGLKNYKVGNMNSIELSISAARAKEAKNEVARKYTMYLICKERLAYYTL